MNEKLAKAKSYVTAHAPELVTAVASVGTLVAILLINKTQEDRRQALMHGIALAKDEGWDFDVYPGVGLFLNELKKD